MIVTRGFCLTKDMAAALAGFGLPAKAIYQDGRGAEDLEACLASFRDRRGTLVIAPDLRVFGTSKQAVANVMARLERAGIEVVDAIHPQDQTVAEKLQRAFKAISGSRFRDRRRAKRQGRAGGLARGLAAQDARDGTIPREVVARIVQHNALPWKVKLEILGPGFSESTLRRRYSRGAA